ncbi:Ca2+-dependent phosphoinositide-specific phospholipase C [Celerinatantimonas sp. YJH-8]|uniref:Ca2+-dependent phosphoinositide-specific phospholipase C n=1 Tax=Celerinatantimonas sp. YJH-8 TaxID=3228714 RepID=UPI0038CB8A70
MNDNDVRYNQVRQKSSHNSYQRTEGYPDQALYWRIRSMEIDIHNSNDGAGWPKLAGNWYVYHASVVDQDSSVNTLADALDVLWAFHQAVPDHEVISLWLDLKDSFDASADQTPASLDQLLIHKLGREQIWGAPDLIADYPNLQAAVDAQGWPTLAQLRGKFIFGCTTGNLSSTSSVLNQYVENGATANQRLCFVTPEITSTHDITAHNYAVMFNLSASHTQLAQSVFEAGFVSRAYGLNSKSNWQTGWNAKANHLGTNKVNALEDSWARTDLTQTGYPFTGIDVTLDPTLTEPGALYAIQVNSGDIWSNHDSFYFRYDEVDTTHDQTFSAFVANPQSHVNGWIKGGLMVRSSLSDTAAYAAVLQTASHNIRFQYRIQDGHQTDYIDAEIPDGVNGKPIVHNNTPIWFQLTIQNHGKNVGAYYSIDHQEWIKIGTVNVTQSLSLQGWAAASHGDGDIKWLFGSDTVPTQEKAIGTDASGHFIQNSAEAARIN